MAHKQDINDFHARVKRINSPANNAYYDPDLKMHVPKRVTRERIKQNAKKDSFLSAFLVSMIIGALGLMVAQAIRFRYFGVAETGNVALFIDVLIAVWCVLILSALMKRRKLSARFAQVMGIGAMIVAGHNLIWRWPDEMAILYSKPYVEQVMAQTAPVSLVVGDMMLTMP